MRTLTIIYLSSINFSKSFIICRYWLGLQNFFNIFATIVDSWSFYDNVDYPLELANDAEVINHNIFTKIKESCLNRKK